MTEKQDREIELRDLAKKFAGGDKAQAGEWLKTLRQAVTDGRLESREKRVSSGGVARRSQTVGHTFFAGMPARVVAPVQPQTLMGVYRYVTPAAVAAWLATLPDDARKDIRSQGWAWLGTEWPVADAGKATEKPIHNESHEFPPFPGNEGKRTSTQLGRRAAWQIECETGRHATVEEVLKLMREWGNSGDEPYLLPTNEKMPSGLSDAIKGDLKRGAVLWQTKGGDPRSYTREACEKDLARWHESRPD